MKKLVVLLLVSLMCFCFAACGKKEEKAPKASHLSNNNYSVIELTEEEVVAVAAQRLGVPDSDKITYKLSEKYYWDAADLYYKNIVFYEDGEEVASASINYQNGELLKSIYFYSKGTQ